MNIVLRYAVAILTVTSFAVGFIWHEDVIFLPFWLKHALLAPPILLLAIMIHEYVVAKNKEKLKKEE